MNLRLLLLEECNRTCRMCCNKSHDLAALPVCTDLAGFDEIILTGGEPMLNQPLIRHIVEEIRKVNAAPIYVYTAWTKAAELHDILQVVNGITLTLHTKRDVEPFLALNERLRACPVAAERSLRLNVFKGIELPADADLSMWRIQEMTWLKNCPVPQNEVLMRWPGALLKEAA